MHFYDELLVNDCLLDVSPVNNSDFGIWAGGLIFPFICIEVSKIFKGHDWAILDS